MENGKQDKNFVDWHNLKIRGSLLSNLNLNLNFLEQEFSKLLDAKLNASWTKKI